MNNVIFNLPETLMATGALAELDRRARGMLLRLMLIALYLCALLLISILDFEVYFRVFEAMTEGQKYWNATIMACIPGTMLLAFHQLAKHSPNHVVVRLVNALSGFIVVAFLIGGGLYIAALLYIDAGPPSAMPLPIPTIGGLPPMDDAGAQQSWLDALFANVTSPMGVIAMSLGIGGVSVVSVFAGSHLITGIEQNIRKVYLARRILREGREHYRAAQAAEMRYAELADEYERLQLCTDEKLVMQIAGLVLQTISTHTLTHERRLIRMRFATPETLISPDHSAEIKRVEAALKPIRELSLTDVLNALSFTTNVRNLQ